MSEGTQPTIRVTDDVIRDATFAAGAAINHTPLFFKFDFVMPDEVGGSDYVVLQRVLVDPTAMESFVNEVNLHWNMWKIENDGDNPS